MKTLAKIVDELKLEVLTCSDKLGEITPPGG